MLKLSVSFSKKVPGSAEYSSDGFLAALESEVSDSALNNPRELRERMLFLWNEANKSVEDQIAGNGASRTSLPTSAPPQAAPEPRSRGTNGDQPATSKQVKYLLNLAQREHGMKIGDIKTFLLRTVGNDDPHRLTKAQASTAIEQLVGKEAKS